MNLVKQLLRPIYAPLLIRYRHQARFKQQQEMIHAQVEAMRQSNHALKVMIGAGITEYDGWVTTDIPAFDILKHEHWAVLFQPDSVNRMLAEHVFEHLTIEQFQDFLRIARIYLADGGRIRIAIPDGYHSDPAYIEHVRPGGIGEGADDHKVLYTCDLMTELLTAQGYGYQFLEYFDSDGVFHQVEWDVNDGFIKRSAQYDKRNLNGKLAYTSLIVDFWVKS
jgi:predicted SAM-dependent methyltransferase